MYNVYQHWDPLKVCIVGKSYSPQFYSFIENDKVRTVMERIAKETEEDYQKFITLLNSFGVKVLRPTVSDNYQDYIIDGKIMPPPMCPRDWTIMLGNKFYFKSQFINSNIEDRFNINEMYEFDKRMWNEVLYDIHLQGNLIINDINIINPPKDYRLLNYFNSAMTTRIGKDLYFGTYDDWWTEGKSYYW